MNLARPFIARPVATVLLTIALALAGIMAFIVLPVARLPAVDFPVIFVTANLPGASPADMARAVATPLERTLGTIAGVNEMTSSSSSGSSRVVLQFDLDRNIDSAARDVQAAINAARADLPASLRSNPSYRKANPAAQPFMILALTSQTRTPGQIYDAVSSIMSQRLLQVPGVGDVQLGGGSLPAVRVELNPFALGALGLSGEDVRAAIQGSNANRPLGAVQTGTPAHGRQLQVLTPAPGLRAADYRDLVVGMRDGSEIRLSRVAEVRDDVEDRHTRGMYNGRPAVIASVTQQPNANLIATADAIRKLLPSLQAQLPPDVTLDVALDSTGSIRTSVRHVQTALVIAVLLVVVVVGLFLRNLRAAAIPAVATCVSLLGTFAVMFALGFSLNNLTLMALTVATGFVVDDAIVVLENISRYLEQGRSRRQAALDGAREVGFTVLTISVSLVAVFIPLLFMGGQAGRLFREFAVTLSAAVMISLLISLTTTPMLCAMWLPQRENGGAPRQSAAGWLRRALAATQQRLSAGYARALDWSLQWPWLIVLLLAAVIATSALLFVHIPKGFFPEQDNGQLFGMLRADQSISSTAMGDKLQQAVDIMNADPAMESVVAFAGGRGAGGGFLAAALKPLSERAAGESTRAVINRLRPRLEKITGLSIFLMPSQELRMGGGGRFSSGSYQYVLKADNQDDLNHWTRRLADALRQDDRLVDVDADQNENGVETYVRVDRAKAASMGVSAADINAALYDAFGQRQVATMYSDLNQYSVVMEWAPQYATSPAVLRDIQVPARASSNDADRAGSAARVANPALRDAARGDPATAAPHAMVPLSVLADFSERAVPATVRHDGGELSATISFDLAEGVSLEQGRSAVLDAVDAVAPPNNVRGAFAGAAAAAQEVQSEQGLLILAAIVVIYIVLGILYESLIHPITVLSTLPSAGFGAVVALLVLGMDFSIMALIGVFLLIGIVKKNAILIIDFAIEAQRTRGLTARQAAREASLLRFRPILMTTLAAGMGALPLAIGLGQGAELHRPLGVTIVGGLIASQFLTLLTTPAVYVLLDRLRPRRTRNPQARALPSVA